MPYIQQKSGTESCGACAASYVLEDFGKATFNNWNDVQQIWNKIQLPKNGVLPDGSSDPTLIAKYLKDIYGLPVECCMPKASPLAKVATSGILAEANTILDKDGLNDIKKDKNKLGIVIYALPKDPAAAHPPLHYMATRYKGNSLEIIDSNDDDAHRKWKPYSKIFMYARACIVVTKK
jgi:hypothetical protein